MNFLKEYLGKAVNVGVAVTPDMLAKINGYALKELTGEEVYVRRLLMAHNAIDRDNERFPETMIDDFARTLPGKGLLLGHARPNPGVGLYFDANIEEMTRDQFEALTKEKARLPEGVSMVRVLFGWGYMLKAANESFIANVEAGISRFVSLGFQASGLKPVRGGLTNNTLYWEYEGPGEATEGSFVWLGAQPGAMAVKNLKNMEGGRNRMKELKEFLEKLGAALKKTFTESGLFDELMAVVAEKDAAISEKDAKVKELEAKLTEMEPLHSEGKAFREGLIGDYVSLKAKLGEVSEKAEEQETLKGVAAAYPLAFLKSEVKALQARVEEKFPAAQLEGDSRRNKSQTGETENVLIPDDRRK